MATMRNRPSTMPVTTTDRNKAVVVINKKSAAKQMADSNLNIGDAADTGVNTTHAVCATRSPIDCTDRFRKDFIDPLFPVKAVHYAGQKRAFDIAFATLFLIFSSPILLVLALMVRLTSRGPILFKQIRVGRGGRYFHCYKFRSMCVDAEAKKDQLMHLNEADGPVFKIKQDPRITPCGAFMRKFSLDELPQFVNVLKGDMSIVGPRPPITCEVEMYSERDRRRLSVLPGLTRLWQVGGRSNVSFDRWVELDLKYIDTMSLAIDVKIILLTIPAVVTGSGAH